MKKLLPMILSVFLVFSFAACQPKNPGTNPASNNQNNQDDKKDENKNLEGSLEDIMAKIYETAKVSDNFKAFMKDGLEKREVTADRVAYYLGKEGLEFDSAIASEPLMTTSAYSLVLVRAKKDADIEQMKKDIKENVDPRKWICVGVDEKNVIVDNIGDVIILIMSNDEAKPLHDAFLALKG